MRLFCAALICLYGSLFVVGEVGANVTEREARMLFNASLPPNCSRGWLGRGSGLVATCALGGRYQVRFIDGRVVVCGLPSCLDRTREIDGFLRMRGF